MSLDPTHHANVSSSIASIRHALQNRDIENAKVQFLSQLPNLEFHTIRLKYLEDILRDGYSAKLYDIQVILTFLENMPFWDWTLDGCVILHRVNTMFEDASVVAMPTTPLAYFLHQLVSNLDGSSKYRAEAYWYEWFSPTVRAIVMGKPVRIESVVHNEVLYSPGNQFAFDGDRRQIFTWRSTWTPDQQKESFRLIPASTKRDRFYLQSSVLEECLYAADYAKFRRDAHGRTRSRVFAWRKLHEPVGESGHWQLIPIGKRNEKRDMFLLFNPYQNEYLYSPLDTYDQERRHVLTVRPSNDKSILEQRKWHIIPLETTLLEKGRESFYLKQYPESIEYLTNALEEINGPADRIQCRIYRMAAHVRMGLLDSTQIDFDEVEKMGGEKAAIFNGLYHVWLESAEMLLQGTNLTQLSIDCQLVHADQFFIQKEYSQALEWYTRALGINLPLQDKSLQQKRYHARIACAKCYFAMDEIEKAVDILQDGLHTNDSILLVELEVHLLLWLSKCRRRQNRFTDASTILEKAFDLLSAKSECGFSWLRQCLLLEMKVIRIVQKEMLTTLLTVDTIESRKNENDKELLKSGNKFAQQMMDLFHCPLSLEFMVDPVITPNGDTYERAMIERHLEVNGAFDPMTRTPLTTAQLYPNRALKMLMENMLSEHHLGLLLSSFSMDT